MTNEQRVSPQVPKADEAESVLSPAIENDRRETFSSFGIVCLLISFILFIFTVGTLLWKAQYITSLIIAGLGGVFALVGTVLLVQADRLDEIRLKAKLKLTLKDKSRDYFERLVNINVENLSAYYITVKSHANKSFLTALFVGVVGFAFLGGGIYLSLKGGENAPDTAKLAAISGVVTEFISAIFFYLYNKTVRQMKEYHDSLLAVQNILLSFKLVGDTLDPAEKVKMIKVMLEYLVGSHKTKAEANWEFGK